MVGILASEPSGVPSGTTDGHDRTVLNRRSDPPILRTVHLSKIFDSGAGRVVALRDVNFQVQRGDFVSIIGPSGCGKSTLLNLVGALDKPTSGKVFINGLDIFSLSDNDLAAMRNRSFGFVFQSYNLINRATVLENVEIPAIIEGADREERTHRALVLLRYLGIEDKAFVKPTLLSGGQSQRVAIARALMNNPAIILADEPTGNLDTKAGMGVFSLLKTLSAKFGRTIIMVTHNQDLANLTHRSIYLRDGAIEKEVVHSLQDSLA